MLASTGRRIASSSTTLAKRLSSEDLAGLASAAVKQCVGGPATAARALSSAADSLDIKAVLEQKIPVEQVCGGVRGPRRGKERAAGRGTFFFFSSRASGRFKSSVFAPPAHRAFPPTLPPTGTLESHQKGARRQGSGRGDGRHGHRRHARHHGERERERVDASLDGRESNGPCVRHPSRPLCLSPPHTHQQGLLWETSLLDAEEGIKFRGYSIPECQVRRKRGGSSPVARFGLFGRRRRVTSSRPLLSRALRHPCSPFLLLPLLHTHRPDCRKPCRAGNRSRRGSCGCC